jgi:glycosyltransferase involved in cell wall biosynthesis
MDNDMFSIVIPCKNEERFIGKALQSIRRQSIVTSSTPVYIADARSTDCTLEVINLFHPNLNIRIIPGGLPPTGRNNGAGLCSTKYILFMDADIELGNPYTLERVLNTAEKNKLELVIPQILIAKPNLLDKVFEAFYYLAAKSKLLGAFGTGMFLFIKAETFQRLGGFNEHLPLGDDWELSNQVDPARFALADAFVYTSNRRFISQGYLSTFYQWTSVALRKKYREQGHREYFREGHYHLQKH